MRKHSLLLFASVLLVSLPVAGSGHAQGMRSAGSTEAAKKFDVGKLEGANERQVATLQRLLRRLGYLREEDVSRELDLMTTAALGGFLSETGAGAPANYDALLRLLFTAVWEREGWGRGEAAGQDRIVERDKVKESQEALKKLGYEPGPLDGKFGPATLASIEVFQQDIGMKIDGLLTENTHEGIKRALLLAGEKPKGTVRVLNWPGYIDPAVLERFTRETKIQVIQDVSESSDSAKELLLAKSALYDIVVQGSSQIRPVLAGRAVKEIDRKKLPNYGNLDPEALRYTARLDPDNKHSLPYMWGTVGIGVDEAAVKKAVPDVQVDSLSIFLDPKIAKRLSSCGLAIVDEPAGMAPALVTYVGGDIANIGIADLEAVEQLLSQVAPYVTVVPMDRFVDEFAAGKYCAALGYSGDVFRARAKAGKNAIAYHVPSEGSQLWFDLLVIPANAPNVDEAYKLLNFLLDGEVAAANTNYLHLANPNKASAPYIDPDLMNDVGLYPSAEVLARLQILPPLNNTVQDELRRIWTKLRRPGPERSATTQP
jgi:putrescine transport system substrate-binding protein